MNFLNPWMLLGLAGVGVPIIIHLLHRRRVTHIVWAAMRFLHVAIEQNQRRLRIEDLLLLLLRCLLLALLALALARPAFRAAKTNAFGAAPIAAVIVLDNSASMGQSDGVHTTFDKARDIAGEAIETLPAGSSVALHAASDIAQPLLPDPTRDLNYVRKTIRDATITDRSTDLFPALERAFAILRNQPAAQKELYLITDGQALGWRQFAPIEQLLADNKSSVHTHIILTGPLLEQNLALTDLHLAAGLAPAGELLRFEARVTNTGRQNAEAIRVNLSVDNEPPVESQVITSLAPGASKTVALYAKLRTAGTHTVTATLPSDRLPADDTRTIVVRAIKDVRVLLVEGTTDDGFYLRHALQPVTPAALSRYFIRVTTLPANDLETARLEDYDVVILTNVPQISPAAIAPLTAYLGRGGGLLIFPGSNINLGFYNDQLLSRYALLPASLEAARGDASSQEKFFTLQDKNYDHPLVSIWNDPAAGTLAAAKFYRAFPLRPAHWPRPDIPWAGPPQVVLRFADGTPALVERPWRQGRVLLFASTGNTAWNDLPVHPSFVPLIQRSLSYVVQHSDDALNIKVGENFRYPVTADALGKDAQIIPPPHDKPSRDFARVDFSDGVPLLQFAGTDFAGTYNITIAADPPIHLTFAAQPDPAESTLAPLSTSQRETISRLARITEWPTATPLRELIQHERAGAEFWLPLAALVLIVGLVETYLAQEFSRSK